MKNLYLIIIVLVIINSSLNAQWVQTNGPYDASGIRDLIVNHDEAGDTSLVVGSFNGNVFRSTDNGESWNQVSEISNTNIHDLSVSGPNIFAGTTLGVFRSTDNGTNWVLADSALTNYHVRAIAVSGNNVFAGTGSWIGPDGDIFFSTNYGTSWSAVGRLPGTSINALAIAGANHFAGTFTTYSSPPFGIFLSTNNGISWTSVNNGLTDGSIVDIAVSDSNLFAGTNYSGVFRSTNNGTTWTAINNGLTNKRVRSLAVCPNGIGGKNLLAATAEGGNQEGGVFLSTNNGESWAPYNSGFPSNTNVSAFVISGTNLFAGTNTFGIYPPIGVWRRPLSDMITAVEDQRSQIPSQFLLEQNYPNPFNPFTKIKFQIPTAGIVSLKIYDVLGIEVTTLINEEKPAGTYEVKFDGSGLSSGIYFYMLKASKFSETKKLLLMK